MHQKLEEPVGHVSGEAGNDNKDPSVVAERGKHMEVEVHRMGPHGSAWVNRRILLLP